MDSSTNLAPRPRRSDQSLVPIFNPVAKTPAPQEAISGQSKKWLVMIIVCSAVILAMFVALALNDYHAHKSMQNSTIQLSAAENQLIQANKQSAAYRQLLAHEQKQLKESQGTLADAKAQIVELKSALTNSQSESNSQTAQLGVMQACLTGVLTSLTDAGNNNYQTAIAALQSVQSSCNQASAMLG
jgi:septal ring factor EnvC (AmiA/AmiB activator)